MRTLLLVIGWASLIGSVVDGVILLHALWLIGSGAAGWAITVDHHIKDHLSFFYWLVELAYAVFPDGLVRWLLGWPTLLFYSVRIVVGVLIGGWALSVARRMKARST